MKPSQRIHASGARDPAPKRVAFPTAGFSEGRCLQAVLPDPWLAFGTDTLIQAMPMSMQTSAAGIEFAKGRRGHRRTGVPNAGGGVDHGHRRDVVYDLQVDTTHTEALECAEVIAAYAQSPR